MKSTCSWQHSVHGFVYSALGHEYWEWAYLENIKAKTGKSPEDFRALAVQTGFTDGATIKAGVKAGDVVQWLKDDFQLGHGHATAIYELLTDAESEDSEKHMCYSLGL